MPKKNPTVYICAVHHRHGEDLLVGWTKKQVTDLLLEYVKDWWSEWDFDVKMPRAKGKAIDMYFNGEKHEEWCEFFDVDMPEKPKRAS